MSELATRDVDGVTHGLGAPPQPHRLVRWYLGGALGIAVAMFHLRLARVAFSFTSAGHQIGVGTGVYLALLVGVVASVRASSVPLATLTLAAMVLAFPVLGINDTEVVSVRLWASANDFIPSRCLPTDGSPVHLSRDDHAVAVGQEPGCTLPCAKWTISASCDDVSTLLTGFGFQVE